MYSAYNPNPIGARVGDCTVRAISRATGEGWDTVYCGLCVEGLRLCDMPTANHVWGAYLRRHGFRRSFLNSAIAGSFMLQSSVSILYIDYV